MLSSPIRCVFVATVMMASLSCQPVQSLPDEYLGRWFFTGTSGGIAGASSGGGDGRSIVITADNTIEHYGPDGVRASVESFELTRGATIFGPDAWILEGPGMLPRVATVYEGDVLTLADNVYDGFASSYTRERP